QKRLLEDGGRIIQETRFWDTKTQKTSPMRGKEDAHDYRYFPDPDLLPLVVGKDWIRGIKKSMPELPDVRQQRFITQYGLRPYDAGILTSERDTADYFEDCLQGFSEPDAVSKWIIGPLLGLLNVLNVPVAASPVSAAQLAELLRLVDQGLISSKMAKTVFDEMAQTRKSPGEIVKEKGLVQVTDRTVIEKAVMEVLTDFPDEVIAYQQGKTKLTGFFVGQIMKKTRGQANPEMANRVLRSQLDNLKKNKNQTVIIKKGDFS
ncbi:MAG: Asp-tRNA(Asn)/Glu-tRNA(Gln) amidotransferase GatCAB subunit B, partial [Desulfobacterales bacterium]|nr:Asp-tRNA(Asn)/Glu-tRNA(Gln) amidotransferase GatCAB subunit B [Desulfobacterales bacterium]